MRRRIAAIAAFLAVSASGAAAQSEEGGRIERVGEGVYAILHDDATHGWPDGTTEWPHGNTGVVVGDDGVLVVDATYLPSRARHDIELIRSVTDQPVRYLVNTHWHGDHTHGNGVYREVFPDVTIVGQWENRAFIAFNLERYPRNATAPGSQKRQTLERLEGFLASGSDSAGRPLAREELQALERNVRERREELEGLAAVRVVPPQLLFDGELTLFLGERRVELRNRGAANSPADVTVYVPDERVLFTGDIVVHPVPYAWQSHPVPWIAVLRELEATPLEALVPGHGPVMRDHAYTRQVRELLEAATARVREAALAGRTAEEVQTAVSLEDLRDRFVHPDDPSAPVFWESSMEALLERSWACLVGYRC